ncbi:MAG: PEGA domain-containing protein [Patescibacteria group bacterium]|nr:PEGA domain-containing protein [Patescibacteria group bacterium]
MNRRVTIFLTTFTTLLSITVIAILVARGYTYNFAEKEIKKTGMILAQSTPSEAKVYLDGKLVETTNSVLDSVTPGMHNLEIKKEGFTTWEKEVEVFEGLITEIDALLVLRSPRLNPMTASGIEIAKISPTGERIAYTSRRSDPPGIWVLELTSPSLLNIIQENPRLIAADTLTRTFSLAENLEWGPKENTLLVTLNPRGYVVLDTRRGTQEEATTSAEPTLAEWETAIKEKRKEWLNKIEIEEEFEDIALDPNTKWSHDEKRFLFTKDSEKHTEWHVYNGEKPLGVGKKRHYLALRKGKDSNTRVSWYATSKHLIIQEEKKISVIDIDGKNQKEVYSGNLEEGFPVTATPDGSNLIILTSFKENSPPNLYALGIR